MVLLGNKAQMEARFRPFGDRVIFVCKIGARFAPNVPQLQKSFWMQRMVLPGDEAQIEARFGPFGYSANLDSR
jgi:hypothetical protein